MKFNIIIDKESKKILNINQGSDVDKEFLNEFHAKNKDKEYYAEVETDIDVLSFFSKDTVFAYVDGEIIRNYELENEIREKQKEIEEKSRIDEEQQRFINSAVLEMIQKDDSFDDSRKEVAESILTDLNVAEVKKAELVELTTARAVRSVETVEKTSEKAVETTETTVAQTRTR